MRKFAFIGLLLATIAPAAAQQTPQAGTAPGNSPGNNAGAPQGHATPSRSLTQQVDRMINEMHRRLHITAEQQPAWDAFAKVMRDNADRDEAAFRDRATHFESLTALGNLQSFAQIEQQRAQGVQNLVAAFTPLYDSLSDEQKKTADSIFRRQEEARQERRQGHK